MVVLPAQVVAMLRMAASKGVALGLCRHVRICCTAKRKRLLASGCP